MLAVCVVLPDLGINAGKIDLLVEPAADPVVTAIGNELGKPPTYL